MSDEKEEVVELEEPIPAEDSVIEGTDDSEESQEDDQSEYDE